MTNHELIHPDALEAAREEVALQVEAAITFDQEDFRLGQPVLWRLPNKHLQGTGTLVLIGAPIEVLERDKQGRPLRWRGSLHVQVEITMCQAEEPKGKRTALQIASVPTEYREGTVVELRKANIFKMPLWH